MRGPRVWGLLRILKGARRHYASTLTETPEPEGCVLSPNVKPLIEMMDMRQAQRSCEANLNVIKAAKSMLSQTIDILR